MNQEILKVLRYYSHYSYPPREREIYRYLSVKATTEEVHAALEKMCAGKSLHKRYDRYATDASFFDLYERRQKHADILIRETSWIIHLICQIPSIYYVGISGSLAMHDALPDDDVDLMLIVKPHTVWKTRAIVLLILRGLSLLGNRSAQKVCVNMIWSAEDLKMPKHKQTEYGGHELLQLRTCMNKRFTHESLLHENGWTEKFFQNVHKNTLSKKMVETLPKQSKKDDFSEKVLQWIQKRWLAMKGFRVTEYKSQIWLIQEDWENRIHRKEM